MKTKLTQISLIGGFYLLISFCFGFFLNIYVIVISAVIFACMLIFALITLFIKPRKFLEKFNTKFPKISLFMTFTGWTSYLLLPIYVFAGMTAYNAYFAAEHTSSYDLIPSFEAFLKIYFYFYLAALAISMLTATYVVVRKIFKKTKAIG